MKKYKFKTSFTFDGKRYQIYADTEKELIRKSERRKMELEQGRVSIESSMFLSDWASCCVETYKVNVKEKTKQDFIYTVRRSILSHLGNLKLKDIKPLHCQQVLNYQQGKSTSQINKVYQALQFLMNKAEQQKLINENPAKFVQKPSGVKKTRRALTEYEQEIFTEVAMTNRKYYGFLLMLYCGCRPSEAYNCKGQDIQSVDNVKLLHICGTKTKNANRYVPLPNCLYGIIKDTPRDMAICVTSKGNRITENYMRKTWNSYKRNINLRMGCKTYRNQLIEPYPLDSCIVQYCLRHTYCTNLAKNKIDIRMAQKLMGHSDISITANIYTHVDRDDVIEVAKNMNLCVLPPALPKPISVEK